MKKTAPTTEYAVNVFIPFSPGDIAHLLGRPGSPGYALRAVERNLPDVPAVVFVNANEQIAFDCADVKLRSVRYWRTEKTHSMHTVVYFRAILTGTEDELAKVVGEGKPFLPIQE